MGAGLEEPAPELSDLIANLEGDPLQGRHILGDFPDNKLAAAGKHFRVSATPANRPNFQLSVTAAGAGGVNGAHLIAERSTEPYVRYEGADPRFEGIILDDATGTGRQIRISKVETLTTSPPESAGGITSTLYFLQYRDPRKAESAEWTDYCGDEGGGAIALAGYYDSKRIHQLHSPSDSSTPSISFACQDGAAQKCTRWGYIAGNAGPGVHDPDWDHHQACTAMANADYCGTGESHSFEGTPIRIHDFRPNFANPAPTNLSYPPEFPMNPDRYYIEAVWGRNGTPHCLSRSRWSMLPPEQCPGVLHPSKSRAAQFCEDIDFNAIDSEAALLVSASKVMTAPLLHWRNPYTGDDVTTLHGYREHLDVRSAPGRQHAPFPDYSDYKGVDSLLLRNLPSTLQAEGKMIPLYMHVNEATGDRVIAPLNLDLLQQAGYEPGDLEGYSFSASIDGPRHEAMKPLWLCRLDNDYLVTTAPASLGCHPVEQLGYALPPPPPSSDTP